MDRIGSRKRAERFARSPAFELHISHVQLPIVECGALGAAGSNASRPD
jgi:hypothetical protein